MNCHYCMISDHLNLQFNCPSLFPFFLWFIQCSSIFVCLIEWTYQSLQVSKRNFKDAKMLKSFQSLVSCRMLTASMPLGLLVINRVFFIRLVRNCHHLSCLFLSIWYHNLHDIKSANKSWQMFKCSWTTLMTVPNKLDFAFYWSELAFKAV